MVSKEEFNRRVYKQKYGEGYEDDIFFVDMSPEQRSEFNVIHRWHRKEKIHSDIPANRAEIPGMVILGIIVVLFLLAKLGMSIEDFFKYHSFYTNATGRSILFASSLGCIISLFCIVKHCFQKKKKNSGYILIFTTIFLISAFFLVVYIGYLCELAERQGM